MEFIDEVYEKNLEMKASKEPHIVMKLYDVI